MPPTNGVRGSPTSEARGTATSEARGTATSEARGTATNYVIVPGHEQSSSPGKPPAPNYTTMDLATLEAEIRQLEHDRVFISEQIADDWAAGNPRGEAWRKSAGTALSHKVAWLHLANSELERREKLTATTDRLAEKYARAALRAEGRAVHEAQREVSLARAKEKEAGARLHEARIKELQAAKDLREANWRVNDARQNQMFVEAARAVLSREDFLAIWALAKEMNPADPAWRDKP
jgi:hypothetical protein